MESPQNRILLMADALSVQEFKKRDEGFNQQLRNLVARLADVEAEEARQRAFALDWALIRQQIENDLSFRDGINSALVATIVDKIVLKKESTKHEIHLDIFLKNNTQYRVTYNREKCSASISPSTTVNANGEKIWTKSKSLKFRHWGSENAVYWTVKLSFQQENSPQKLIM